MFFNIQYQPQLQQHQSQPLTHQPQHQPIQQYNLPIAPVLTPQQQVWKFKSMIVFKFFQAELFLQQQQQLYPQLNIPGIAAALSVLSQQQIPAPLPAPVYSQIQGRYLNYLDFFYFLNLI